jgi:uncharacterized protein YjiS (DUF1127 family)
MMIGSDRVRLSFRKAHKGRWIMQMQATQPLVSGQGAIAEQEADGHGAAAFAGLLGRIARVLKMVAEERGRRRAIRELRRLDNHSLADIGIKRGEIERAVRYGRGGL